eukprot:8030882-Ditylum_brightwellii.AAC.1
MMVLKQLADIFSTAAPEPIPQPTVWTPSLPPLMQRLLFKPVFPPPTPSVQPQASSNIAPRYAPMNIPATTSHIKEQQLVPTGTAPRVSTTEESWGYTGANMRVPITKGKEKKSNRGTNESNSKNKKAKDGGNSTSNSLLSSHLNWW